MNSLGLVIKVGGSLCEPLLLPRLAAAITDLATMCNVIIIPGGGPFADVVRDWDTRLQLSCSASHWMAVAAMNQYGLLLESQGMGVACEDSATLFSPCKGAHIFLPYRFLRDTDPLPHTWSVTSDSIAAYLASFLKVDRLVLLKPTDDAPLSPCPARLAVDRGIVDGYFDRYLSESTECWIINGNDPQRLLDLQNAGCPGSRVIPTPVNMPKGE